MQPEAGFVGGGQETCSDAHEPVGQVELFTEASEVEVSTQPLVESSAVAVFLRTLRILPAGLFPVICKIGVSIFPVREHFSADDVWVSGITEALGQYLHYSSILIS